MEGPKEELSEEDKAEQARLAAEFIAEQNANREDKSNILAIVIFCPVCCSNFNADEKGWQKHECLVCETRFALEVSGDGKDQEPLMALLTDEDHPVIEEEFTGARLLCPTCQGVTDAEDWGAQVVKCDDCSMDFWVLLIPSIVAEHAMVG